MRVEDMIPINDSMPEEQLMAIMILKESFDEKARLEEVKALRDENLPWHYYWDEPYLYKRGPDSIYRRCIAEEDVQGVLEHCHGSVYGGHFATFKTATKTSWDLSNPSSNGHNYILVAVDYVSKWIEAIPCPTCDAKVVVKLFRTIIFPRFGIPRVVISDGGSHFINKVFEKLMRSHGVKHKVATPYHPQTSGQVEVSNRQIKAILEKTVSFTRKDWAARLDEALWAYRTAYKTPIGRSPFNLLYGKDCHLPVEVEYKALWAVKMLNFDIKAAQERRVMNLFELEEIRMNAYENSRIYKMRTKAAHDKLIRLKDFKVGDSVLLYNSKLRLFPGKLRSKWAGPFKIHEVLPYGSLTLLNQEGKEFTVNGHRCKPYLGMTPTEEIITPLEDPTPA
ncbi:unnamed protein product [Microthlaspi erraticum]|uniref:Integrase catalytic domain-containing protein n=1 Tax=Microthlaspi erraticum TaxID=1685480 RepID=A0A6D2JI12_9BRAS|nr:unnamed protein product [Microthlaspi erraticum]